MHRTWNFVRAAQARPLTRYTVQNANRHFSFSSGPSVHVLLGDTIGGDGLVITKSPDSKIDSALIWLHGLGDTAYGWYEPMALIAAHHPSTRFILPTAPSIPVTLNNGYVMPAWMDIKSLPSAARLVMEEDDKGLEQACSRVLEIIQQQLNNGIARDRVILGGFSQGGAVVLHTALTHSIPNADNSAPNPPVDAVIACSTWLPYGSKYPEILKPSSKNIRLLQCHGTTDDVVKVEWASRSHQVLRSVLSQPPLYKEYPMQHAACEDELQDISAFIKTVL